MRKYRGQIRAAIECNLSNSKIEGTNSKIRFINDSGYGRHPAEVAMVKIYLCRGGLTIELLTSRLTG